MKKIVQSRIEELISSLPHTDGVLKEAMAYSALAGGKYIRSSLFLNAVQEHRELCEKDITFAACIEMIHTFSLIHDDLPALDNDDLRRGKPSCHRQYDEATAILAGDALLAHAAKTFMELGLTDTNYLKAGIYFMEACGAGGMIYGEHLDVYFEGQKMDEELFCEMVHMKTGALIKACFVCAWTVCGKDPGEISLLGEKIGLLFQLQDDYLDISSTKEILGKEVHSDEAANKNTFFSVYGKEKSLCLMKELTEELRTLSANFNSSLKDLITAIIERSY